MERTQKQFICIEDYYPSDTTNGSALAAAVNQSTDQKVQHAVCEINERDELSMVQSLDATQSAFIGASNRMASKMFRSLSSNATLSSFAMSPASLLSLQGMIYSSTEERAPILPPKPARQCPWPFNLFSLVGLNFSKAQTPSPAITSEKMKMHQALGWPQMGEEQLQEAISSLSVMSLKPVVASETSETVCSSINMVLSQEKVGKSSVRELLENGHQTLFLQ